MRGGPELALHDKRAGRFEVAVGGRRSCVGLHVADPT